MTYVLTYGSGDQAFGYQMDPDTTDWFIDHFAPPTFEPIWQINLNGGDDYLFLADTQSFGPEIDFVMNGGAGNDTLAGATMDDTLDGGIGNDQYFESFGNDTYYIDSAEDIITDIYFATDEISTDTVMASIDYALGANMESLFLLGSADLNGYGNTKWNHITGNTGSNILDGLQGGDTLEGLQGDDIYVIDSTFDVVIEKSGQGSDIVESGVSYTLSQYVEQGFLNSAGRNQNLTGNTLGNLLVGNSGKNQLSGMNGADELRGEGGNDTLIGGAGIDTLDGGSGADRMEGGLKNDIYYVDNGLDQVIETDPTNAGGYDTVFTSVAIEMPDNVEKLIFNGFDDGTMLSGNDLANYLQGNYTDDIIEAGAGNDTGAGGSGNDSIGGGTGNDSLTGDYGDDTLQGDAGRDALTGGQGADTFVFIGTTDSNGSTTDTIRDFQDAIDRIDLSAVDASPQNGNQAFTFIGTAGFSAAGQIRATYDAGANVTRVDVSTDSDSTAEMTILLSGNHSLTADNFIL